MSNVIYSMMVSLDGFIARPNGDLDWVSIDEELHSFANERERNVGTHLYGRRMYETMAAHWPTADQQPDAHAVEVEYALLWQQMPKVVYSTTLERVDWNARLVREVVADEVNALKAAATADMSVSGASIAATFMQLDLIDTYEFYLQPVILGEGIPLFASPDATRNLRLVETCTFDSGVVFLHYQRPTP
ncbi:MAG TPA: dihydrofolate reductase family protein [Thermomicrobiales bacterium]|nr:dihydrofolate reductase family protein [Thermomicrobiales bacterium]